MSEDRPITIVPAWKKILEICPRGLIFVIGGLDRGKSTCVKWLINQHIMENRRTAWVDCDVGQSTLGLPGTLNLVFMDFRNGAYLKLEAVYFVGAVSPRGHMIPMIVGTGRLVERAKSLGAEAIVVDTTGMVSESSGGGALKQWKIEMLQPDLIVGIEKNFELFHILDPLENAGWPSMLRIPPSSAVMPRGPKVREARRNRRYHYYFQNATKLQINPAFPVFNPENACENTVLSLQDADGFSVALGILLKRELSGMEIITPLSDISKIYSLRFGKLKVDPVRLIELPPE
jgi:polynucleotide 5'-hydroxyl-kinase GRC3/NOL9